jgi:class III cytochrome C family protein
MSWLYTCIRRVTRVVTCLAVLVLSTHGHALAAQSLESVVMPGSVIKKHAKLEADCKNCHVRFDRAAQSRLCLGCHDHKDVASDIENKKGYHGRIKERECRVCHTEHKGSGARIIVLDEEKFDHMFTDFTLRGKHAGVKCASCHRANTKHRDAPSDCQSCHRKDDKHKGGLGPKCDSCHSENSWKETRFDHNKTKFPLLHKHITVKCVECHVEQRYANTPRDCVSCHRKDDEHKGQLGTRCEKCHNEAKWKSARFDHDRDTHFPLKEKHRDAKCASCHKLSGFRDKLPVKCVGCHERDDQQKGHKGRYGDKCQTCHAEKAWKSVIFDHDRDTRYVLRAKHRGQKCDACHRGPLYQEKLETRCFACHERDDKHKAQLGNDCRACHSERSWHESSFNHIRSRFPLLGSHARVECKKCHASPAFKDAKMECAACHTKDDVHKGRFVPKCEDCHNAQDWKRPEYDHDRRTHFKLEGAHLKAACHACHKQPVKDKLILSSECLSCHKDDDVHTGTYGPLCQRCHVAENWRKVIKRDGVPGLPAASNAPR